MATPINAPMAGEIWHLSIEDLFQPVQEAPRLGGDGPFVINLSVSTAPINVPTTPFAGCSDAHIFQIQVTEDGRQRFRLRLGPFVTEDQADAILAEVRDTYPGALTATASDSDLRVIASMQAKVDARLKAAENAALEKAAAERAVLERAAAEKAARAKAAADKIAAEKAARERVKADRIAAETAALEKAATDRAAAAEQAAADKAAANKVAAEKASALMQALQLPVKHVAAALLSAESDAEISIDIAWPTPELVIPPAPPPRTPVEARGATPQLQNPAAEPPHDVGPQWSLPELDIPLQHLSAAAPKMAPTLTEVVVPVAKAAPKFAAQVPLSVAAPVLTEAVSTKPRSVAHTPKAPASKPAAVAPTPIAAAPPVAVTPTARSAAAASASTPKRAAPPQQPPSPVLTQSVAALPKAPKLRQSTFNTGAGKLTSLQHVVVASAPAPAAREIKKLDTPLESLESTQTIRALTPKELDDIESRWFVIQLALADHAFDPDAVPNLDIFDEYRLYSVAGVDQGRVVHALRLGFFSEEIGAVAVASYLAAYWEKPTIKRVSLAERERFADQRVEARKDVGATGRHAVIEITDELVERRRRISNSAVSTKAPNATPGH